jgi:hypothetical protein
VCCAETRPSRNIARLDGEYVANNNMSLFAFDMGEVEVASADALRVKYADGRRVAGDPLFSSDVYAEFSPRAHSFRFMVRMTGLVNPHSAAHVSGAVRGFAGSIFPATADGVPRMGFAATHHLALAPPSTGEKTRAAEDGTRVGIAESSVFVSFGPAMAAAGEPSPATGVYFFDPVVTLVDGSEFRLSAPIDITPQVNAIAALIAAHHRGGRQITHLDNLFTIEIADRVVLPPIEDGPRDGAMVGVGEWARDEPVIVWI